ncbi:MAG TPA: hypothetical protein PKD51_03865 [Saprospiraceae bacterium]|nr:hypothetical protein [Saprospiraceae bacterium]HMU02289.1 hypothetical protein [Saprospiraceae bacterium]
MKIKLFLPLLLLTFSGCLSFISYEDGKTIGKSKIEATSSLNIHQAPSIYFYENAKKMEAMSIFEYPNIATSIKYGIGNKTDLYGKFSTNLGLSVGFKHNLLGDRSSRFAIATGAEIGILIKPWLSQDAFSIPNIQIPIYTSYHTSDKFAAYLTPRYVYQFKFIDEVSDFNYFGGNFGILYGTKHKIGIDMGIYGVQVKDLGRLHIFNIGVGGKFMFGQ